MGALPGQTVHVWCLQPGLPFQETHRVVAMIIGKDEDDIAPFLGRLCGSGKRGEKGSTIHVDLLRTPAVSHLYQNPGQAVERRQIGPLFRLMGAGAPVAQNQGLYARSG